MGFADDAAVDLYDAEVKAVGAVWHRLMQEFSTRLATQHNYDELKKRAFDEFLKIGLVVQVDVPQFVVEGISAEPGYGAPEITIIGRVPGSKRSNREDGIEVMDHEKHRAEVLKSLTTGEKYLGQKNEKGI